MSLETLFIQEINTLVFQANAYRYLLAVSGGKDSTALVHLFAAANLDFEIAHCNFHLRGDESQQDEIFVKDLADRFHKKLHTKHFHTREEQRNSGKSIEMVAREERYTWFNEIGQDFDYIVTAHHADDNAETILLNLCRGTGIKGMTGIPTLNGKYLRPLLTFSSAEILNYLNENQIPFRTDSTNLSQQYHRNKIRHSVIPVLQEINPEIIATICQNIAHIKQQYSFYHSEIQNVISEVSFSKNSTLYISIEKIASQESTELILYEILHPLGFSSTVIKNIFASLTEYSGKTFLSRTHTLLKDRKYLIVNEIAIDEAKEITCNNFEELTQMGFTCELFPIDNKPEFGRTNCEIYIDAALWHFPVSIKKWENGDFFYPLGMKGKQKVSDYFNNAKINRFDKHSTPFLCIDNQIVWIVGLRTDRRFAITGKTQQYYRITWDGKLHW